MNDNHELTAELTEAVDALAENLTASEPFLALEGAYLRLQGDAQAAALFQRFRQAEATLRQRQANRTLTQADIAAYRALHAEAQANALIAGYEATQQAIAATLRDVNRDLSQLLGVDFAALARRSGCC
ncbi:MAG: YlbF family regulator [Halothiobacillaceae bacterium]